MVGSWRFGKTLLLNDLSGDADVQLFDSDRVKIQSSYNFGSTTEAINTNLNAGTYKRLIAILFEL
ncbi:hypothetical protein H6F74_13090 [Trichocoleus sp. FACHB-90]|uniref:hypothetical protein n=1 Tax=Cyanophyceae TaxID=3028117 RepID=UPI00168653D5|nr:hypothetical protein [Trichocoleus sp. FACHB-90]MBD1927173.1 hypothetical protein [Trichocoleus sp. FACHB-90]